MMLVQRIMVELLVMLVSRNPVLVMMRQQKTEMMMMLMMSMMMTTMRTMMLDKVRDQSPCNAVCMTAITGLADVSALQTVLFCLHSNKSYLVSEYANSIY